MKKSTASVEEVVPVASTTGDTGSENQPTVATNATDSLTSDIKSIDVDTASIVQSVELFQSAVVFFEGSRNLFDGLTSDVESALASKTGVSDDKDSGTREETYENLVRSLGILKRRSRNVVLELDVYVKITTRVTKEGLRLMEVYKAGDPDRELRQSAPDFLIDMRSLQTTIPGFLCKFKSMANSFAKLKKRVELFHAE